MAPNFSVEMLKNKVFGAFESDLEFRLVHFAMMPLYSEKFDANAGLSSCLDNVYNSEAHSMVNLVLIFKKRKKNPMRSALDSTLITACRRSLL